jgi:hypothetical protein
VCSIPLIFLILIPNTRLSFLRQNSIFIWGSEYEDRPKNFSARPSYSELEAAAGAEDISSFGAAFGPKNFSARPSYNELKAAAGAEDISSFGAASGPQVTQPHTTPYTAIDG